VPWAEVLLVLVGFGLMSIVISWPLLLHFGTDITGGGGGGDPSGYAWDLWYNANQGLSFWGSTTQHIVSAPFGRVSPSAVNVTLFATVGPGWVVASLFGQVAAYNFLALMGLTLSASSMYLLVRWLGLGFAPAIWAGAAFMVFPYEQLRAVAHIPLAQLWCFPLLILVGLRWIEGPSWRRAGWLTAGLAGCWLTNPYYGIMGLVMVGVIVAVGAVVEAPRSGLRRVPLTVAQVGTWVVLVVAVPLMLLQASSKGALDSNLTRSAIELEIYGAHVTDYLIPNADNTFFSGVFGVGTWASIGSPGGERTAFVGYGTMALVLLAGFFGWRRRQQIGRRARLLLVTAAPLLFVLVLFSLASPTRVFGATITMPSSLVFDVAPYVRVFARFAAPVMAVLLAVGALGLRELIRGRSDLARVGAIAAVFLIGAMELPNGAPAAPVLTSAPPVLVNGQTAGKVPTWAWLRDNRRGQIVFEMPGVPDEGLERYFMYGQTVHGHPITNGSLGVGSIATDFMRANSDVRWPGVPERLAGVGIRLVAIEPWAYALLGLAPPTFDDPPAGFRVLKTFADGSAIWEVTAAPAAAVPIPRPQGWWDPEVRAGAVWRWMHKRARTTVVVREAGTYTLGFRVRPGFPRRYSLTVTGPGDAVVGRAEVGAERDVSMQVTLPAGQTDLWTESDLAPERLADGRVVTMQVTDWTLTPSPPG